MWVRRRLRAPAGGYLPVGKNSGMDAAGVVSATGEGVSSCKVGDDVIAIVVPTALPHGGAYAELPTAPAAPSPSRRPGMPCPVWSA
jgi:NADPH:quinone reductase-like Zn-dependent oxidoreductase